MCHSRHLHASVAMLFVVLGGLSHILSSAGDGLAMSSQPNERASLSAFIQYNQFDVDMARIAIRKSVRKDVKGLAEMIVHDHTKLGRKATALQTTLGWTQTSQERMAILLARQHVLADLRSSTPSDFDELYLHYERDFSKDFVQAMKTQWLPSAQHPQFKAFLREVAKQLDEHMAHMSHVGGVQDPHSPHQH